MITSSTVLPVPPGSTPPSSTQLSSTPTTGAPPSESNSNNTTNTNNSQQQASSVQVIGIGGSPDSTTAPGNKDKLVQNNSSGGNSNSGSNNNNSTSMYSLKWNTQLLALQRSLANLWDSGIGTDAVLLCQGTPLPVHKIILTAASPYVASVVQTMATASHMMPVIVVDIPAEAGKALLSFLYCGEAHVPVSVIPQLVIGAKFLGISGFGEPGVLESLTSMVPEHPPSNTCRASPPSPSPTPSSLKSESSLSDRDHHHYYSSPIGHHSSSSTTSGGLPLLHHSGIHISPAAPSPTPSVQSHYSRKSDRGGSAGDRSKSSSPYPPPPHFLESLKLTRVSPGGNSSSNSSTKSSSKISPRGGGRSFLGSGTSILDNLLKNPRGHGGHGGSHPHSQQQNYSDGPVNLTKDCGDDDNNSEHYYRSGGDYDDRASSAPGDDQCDDTDNDNDNGPIPAQLLEPNVEYHIGNDAWGGGRSGLPLSIQNPLIDLAKVASAMQQHQQEAAAAAAAAAAAVAASGQYGPMSTTRGVKRKSNKISLTEAADLISSSGVRHSILDPSVPTPVAPPAPKSAKPKKPQEAIICEICNKKFSNAYNLRVHMEGHSGQVFTCSVCHHASRSRDALRKHFAYRHRELWISGMSAFRKGSVPGRKLSISKPNNNNNNNNNSIIKMEDQSENNNNNNNNSLIDANGKINFRSGGSDGTLTISEAYPQEN